MSCAACARRIEQGLVATPGVRRVNVNCATARATVEYDPRSQNVRRLIDQIRDVGYDVRGTARADFVVDDSARPSGSAVPLEDYLRSVKGVVDGNFNVGTMEVRVDYLPGTIGVRESRRHIESLGYRVAETPPDSAEDSEQVARAAEYRDLRRKFWLAALLWLPVLVIAMSHGAIRFLDFPGVNWLQPALATPVVFYCGGRR